MSERTSGASPVIFGYDIGLCRSRKCFLFIVTRRYRSDVCNWLIVSCDLTDVTLVSEDTYEDEDIEEDKEIEEDEDEYEDDDDDEDER